MGEWTEGREAQDQDDERDDSHGAGHELRQDARAPTGSTITVIRTVKDASGGGILHEDPFSSDVRPRHRGRRRGSRGRGRRKDGAAAGGFDAANDHERLRGEHPRCTTSQTSKPCRAEQLRELQLERMKQSVRHAYDNVAFYQQSFKEAGVDPRRPPGPRGLAERLPFVVKQDMRDAYPFGLFAVPQKDVARIHASSGTTGQATVVGHTASDLKNWGDCFARGIAHGGRRRELHHPGVLRLRPVHGRLGRARRRRGHGLLRSSPPPRATRRRQVQMMKDLRHGHPCLHALLRPAHRGHRHRDGL